MAGSVPASRDELGVRPSSSTSMFSLALDSMKHGRVGLVWLLACAPGCSSYPGPSGTQMRVRVLGEEELLFDGTRMTWGEFETRITERVKAADQGRGPRPWIVLVPRSHITRRVTDRFLDLLQDAGVRSVHFGR